MFDIGGFELLLVAIVGLLIVGPERLPEVLRSLGLWMGRLKRAFNTAKTEIEQEIGMDDIERQLHNESVLNEIKKIEHEATKGVQLQDSEEMTSPINKSFPRSEAELEKLNETR